VSAWHPKITRVDQPEPGLLSLSFRAEGRNEALLLITLPGTLRLGVVSERPRGASAGPEISQLRRHIEGGRITAIESSRRAARIALTRGGETRFLLLAPAKPYGVWWLCDAAGETILRSPGASGSPPAEEAHLRPEEPEALREAGPLALDAYRSARVAQLALLLERQIKRLTKKRDAIRGDLERAATAEELHEKASLILTHISEIPAGAAFFETESWDAQPKPIRIELDPRKSPSEVAQDLFKRSKRMKRGLEVAPSRLGAVEAEIAELRRLRGELEQLPPDEIATKLEELGVSIVAPRERARKRRQVGARLPYREFRCSDGTPVLVGRGAADNDRLTLRVARPHDLWFHARGVTGAHVVVPLAKGKSCPAETLVDAATLAAHFSDLRGEAIVDVLYTPRRFVHKRKGAPIGSVTLGSEKVIAVRVEAARLRKLLESEKKLL
jgi:predicted ribosome quality control (RQC) complex YloA/Tae2 family protein